MGRKLSFSLPTNLVRLTFDVLLSYTTAYLEYVKITTQSELVINRQVFFGPIPAEVKFKSRWERIKVTKENF